jgi:hypothetical protein
VLLSPAWAVPWPADREPQQRTPWWEPHLHRCGPYPISNRATRVDLMSPRCAVGLMGGMRGCTPSTMGATYITTGIAIESGTTFASRGQVPRHSGATCVKHASLSIFGHPTPSSSMMARPIPAFGYRTTTSCAGWLGWTTTFSSSSCSPFI